MNNEISIVDAKAAIDNLIKISRVHLYKPIQVAEILYKHRTQQQLDLANVEEYRTVSKKWRDIICNEFVGRTSTSSAKYQDDLFNEHAIPPSVLVALGKENAEKEGIVEAYIYKRFAERSLQMNSALQYAVTHAKDTFDLAEFINLFRNEPGLKRSVDKILEIVVYSLFDALVEAINVQIEVSYNPEKVEILREFGDFAAKVLTLSPDNTSFTIPGRVHRVGVTNAADRGLDMYSNFGLAIQVKHLSLTTDLAEGIVGTITADRIVIVCKDAEREIILSLLTQIGWRARIQSIIVESDLVGWYERALRGTYADVIGEKVIQNINDGLVAEFPSSQNERFLQFMEERGYTNLEDEMWNLEGPISPVRQTCTT